MKNFRFFGVLVSLVVLQAMHAASSGAHDIKTCKCDAACYTEEVSHISCSGGKVRFSSTGLPNAKDPLMRGIEATNQQFPTRHHYEFEILLEPQRAWMSTGTDAGPVAVPVNGVPIFDPSTQGPANWSTGKRPSAYEAGELDVCGGHAGRGDDYHYHIAPKCLIEDLGRDWVEVEKKPVGYAMDGFPILALGWFEKANAVEDRLDRCRGMADDGGNYFYNVKTTASWDVLNCLSGRPQHFARDHWQHRLDRTGREITGIPIRFAIEKSSRNEFGPDTCHVMSGRLSGEQVLETSGRARRVGQEEGSLFYCNASCYGLFFEADKSRAFGGRAIYYDYVETGCPAGFDASALKTFTPYEGPAQSRKGPPPTGR